VRRNAEKKPAMWMCAIAVTITAGASVSWTLSAAARFWALLCCSAQGLCVVIEYPLGFVPEPERERVKSGLGWSGGARALWECARVGVIPEAGLGIPMLSYWLACAWGAAGTGG